MDIHHLARYVITWLFWAPRFQAMGARLTLYRSMMVAHPRYMRIGAHSSIREGARLEVVLRGHKSLPPRAWQLETA